MKSVLSTMWDPGIKLTSSGLQNKHLYPVQLFFDPLFYPIFQNLTLIIIVCIYFDVCVIVRAYICHALVWRSEENFQKTVLSFSHVEAVSALLCTLGQQACEFPGDSFIPTLSLPVGETSGIIDVLNFKPAFYIESGDLAQVIRLTWQALLLSNKILLVSFHRYLILIYPLPLGGGGAHL